MRAVLLAFVLSLAFGCSAPAGVPGACATTDECRASEVCVDGSCRARRDAGLAACAASDECPAGEACVEGSCRARGDAGLDASSTLDSGPPRDAGPACVPTEADEVSCNLIDDDCDGLVDDVDVADDGICDCLRVGVIGSPGTLASSSFQAWLEARGTTVVRFGLDVAPLTSEQLAAHDVVILDRLTREYSTGEAALLRAFVEAGGGVMSMTGYTGGGEDRLRPNSLLAALGMSYVAELRDGPVTDFEVHALTEGLTSVTFAGGYRVTGAGLAIAHLADGDAAMAQEVGDGRVYVWGDEWVQFDSEWSALPEITQFWVNAVNWLGPRDRCVVLY